MLLTCEFLTYVCNKLNTIVVVIIIAPSYHASGTETSNEIVAGSGAVGATGPGT